MMRKRMRIREGIFPHPSFGQTEGLHHTYDIPTKARKMRREFMEKRVQEVKDLLGRLSEEDQNNHSNALETATKIFQKIQYS
jgi:hypothetical protein